MSTVQIEAVAIIVAVVVAAVVCNAPAQTRCPDGYEPCGSQGQLCCPR